MQNLSKFFPVNILGNLFSPAEAVRNLGVWFNSDFPFSCRNTCKACFVHIRDLKRLGVYLACEAAILVANTLVGSCFDYCNSLFRSLSAPDLHRQQCVQNSVASTHISLRQERVFTGCLLSIALFSRRPYRCTSVYIVVIQNTLTFSFNPDIVCMDLVKVNMMACYLRSHTLHK